MSLKAKKAAVLWFKENEPFIYEVAKRRVELETGVNGLAGWADVGKGIGDIFNKLTTTVTNIAPQYLQYKQQKKVMDMQMRRAEQGLPPANVEDYSPVLRIAPTLTPQTQETITNTAVEVGERAANKMLPIVLAGGGLLAFMLLRKKR